MKINLHELNYELLVSLGLPKASIHTDETDALRQLYNDFQTEKAKKELAEKYGDVELIIDPNEDWFNVIRIDNEKWRNDHDAFCKEKADWCARYGCD